MAHKRRLANDRSAFTLVEILVVIAIIAILAALTTAGIFQVVGSQRASNTRATMSAVMKALKQHWDFVIAEARKEPPSPAARALAGPDPTGERAKVIWVKLRLMEAFPMTFAEIANPSVYTPAANPYIPTGMRKYNSTYLKLLQQSKAFPVVPPQKPSETSACLILALSINRGGAAINPDTFGSSVVDTDADGLREFVDGWGNPLYFYRFPTPQNWNDLQLTNTAPAGSREANFCDPIDPNGTLLDPPPPTPPTWPAASRAAFEALVHKISPTGKPPANYVIPVLVSGGPNYVPYDPSLPYKGFGLDLKDMSIGASPADPNFANDNIYSFQLKSD